jgi:hypothetical protein
VIDVLAADRIENERQLTLAGIDKATAMIIFDPERSKFDAPIRDGST